MIKKLNTPRSLNAKMLYVSIAGLFLGIAAFFLLSTLGTGLIDRFYMDNESLTQRKSEIYVDFSSYVTAEGISGRDTAAVARWTESRDDVTIFLFDMGQEQRRYYAGKAETNSVIRHYDPALYGKLYPVRFVDGLYQIAIEDRSNERMERLVYIISFAGACLSFLLLHTLYTRRLTKRIIALSYEAAEVSAGDLENSIAATGDDELSDLAVSMEEMRRSVIEQMGKEAKAWQANSELITAISHDIRTPMTSLIGYLELLRDGGMEDPERSRQFVESACAKALELKDLTDQLFRYFLVYGKSELELNMESFDGRMLLEQLAGEAQFDLSDSGFEIKLMGFEGECLVSADPLYLKRVLDNIVSNVKKYADRTKPVVVISELKDGLLSLCVSNVISRSMDRVESTKIGLRTCEKIMSAMGGSFTTTTDDDHFAAELTLPAQSQEL